MDLWKTNFRQGITLIRGEGSTVWDPTGKCYLDLLAGTWCNVLGYKHPRLIETIQDQASRLTHVGSSFLTAEITEAMLKLQEILPPVLNRAVFLNTGSEAVELALKMARAATGSGGIVVVERGYYGATIYALTLSETGRSAQYLPQYKEIHRLPIPYCRRCPMDRSWPCEGYYCIDMLRDTMKRGEGQIAAVLYEPVMAVGGMIVPPPGYGTKLRALTSHYGALLIAEEVTTGMGRTGRWFGFEHDGIVPDILVIGKAIGAGLPIAAVVTTEDVEARCKGILHHVQSHQNDPFSGRIAATVISILQEEHLIEQAAERGTYLMNGLKDIQSRCPSIQDVRGKGAMIGVELTDDRVEKGIDVFQRLLDEGFIVDYQYNTATFRLFPPYIISTREIDSFLIAFELSLKD